MNLTVRPYTPEDADSFAALYQACLAHYECDPAPKDVLADVLAELAGPRGVCADMCWHDGQPIGFSCWVRVFPVGPGFGLYLKELFVADVARGTGAGRALMAHLARRAMELDYDQLRWETGEASARQFYARIGAEDDGKTHYTLDGAALRRLAGEGVPHTGRAR